MRIYWQSFIDAQSNPEYMALLTGYLNQIAAPGTEVTLRGISPPDRDFSRLSEFRCAIQAIDQALDAQAEGFDAVVLGHFQDPGLMEMKSALSIPVIGVGEASLHLAAQLGRHGLHAIANAQHRHTQLEYGLRGAVGGFLIHAGMAARQNHALERAILGIGAHPVIRHIAGVDFAKNMGIAHAPGNQLGDLGAEIKNEDFLVLHE